MSLVCSFCGKTVREIGSLIAGPQCYICNECVGICADILGEEGDTTFIKAVHRLNEARRLLREFYAKAFKCKECNEAGTYAVISSNPSKGYRDWVCDDHLSNLKEESSKHDNIVEVNYGKILRETRAFLKGSWDIHPNSYAKNERREIIADIQENIDIAPPDEIDDNAQVIIEGLEMAIRIIRNRDEES